MPALLTPQDGRGRVQEGLILHFAGECQREGAVFPEGAERAGVW